MSRPGFWKSFNSNNEVPITSLSESHLKNSIRYVVRRIDEPGNSPALIRYYQQKLGELAIECRIRGLLNYEDNRPLLEQVGPIVRQWSASRDPQPTIARPTSTPSTPQPLTEEPASLTRLINEIDASMTAFSYIPNRKISLRTHTNVVMFKRINKNKGLLHKPKKVVERALVFGEL